MFRKIAAVALAALTLGTATFAMSASAEARPLYYRGGGAGWHGGWGHRGWGGGGWNGNGWGWGAAGLITGLAAAPLLYGPGYGYGGYGYGAPAYYGDPYYDVPAPACGWRTIKVQTRYGWRTQRARVCY
jgi:hypothetical protein